MSISRVGEASGEKLLIHPDTDSNFTHCTEEMDLKKAYRGFPFGVILLLPGYKAIKDHILYIWEYLGLKLTRPCHVKTV